jgi:hypothetical protein
MTEQELFELFDATSDIYPDVYDRAVFGWWEFKKKHKDVLDEWSKALSQPKPSSFVDCEFCGKTIWRTKTYINIERCRLSEVETDTYTWIVKDGKNYAHSYCMIAHQYGYPDEVMQAIREYSLTWCIFIERVIVPLQERHAIMPMCVLPECDEVFPIRK